ncbi:hypothetical protein GCM10023096_61860 [Nonomuraea ferruginea]
MAAVAVDGDRLVRHRLADQPGHHHAVGRALPGAHGVEEAHDDRVQPALPVIGVDQALVHGLRQAVGPAGDLGPAQHVVRVLPQRHLPALAVDLARAGQQDLLAKGVGRLHDHLRAAHVGDQRTERPAHDQPDSDRRRQVHDHVAALDQLRHQPFVQHRALDEGEAPAGRVRGEVVARGQVVQDDHGMALCEDRFAEMGSDEAGPSSDQVSHGCSWQKWMGSRDAYDS